MDPGIQGPGFLPAVRHSKPPLLEVANQEGASGAVFLKLLGRTYIEPSKPIEHLLHVTHRSVVKEFKPVFHGCLPSLTETELNCRLHFMVGALAYVLAGTDTLQLLSGETEGDPLQLQQLSEPLVQFLTAGLNA